MHATALTPVGAVVDDITVDTLSHTDGDGLRRLLAEHGVLVFRGQRAQDAAFLRFLRSFGELVFTAGETPVVDYPFLNVVSNVGRDEPPRSSFHVDTSYVRNPPAFTALRAVIVPVRGGHTLFSNQCRAYETLPQSQRRDLATRSVHHVVTGVEPGADDEVSAVHPLVQTHPITGRQSLYLTSAARCASVSGLTAGQGRALIAHLLAHCTRPDNVMRHAWNAGDVVMWDNRCVMHRADHAGVIGPRVMHRGMVAG